jgi:hypothetical protein
VVNPEGNQIRTKQKKGTTDNADSRDENGLTEKRRAEVG